MANDSNGYSGFEVVRVNIKTGEVAPVRKSLNGDSPLWFIGLKEGQYLYLSGGKDLYIQSSATQEPVPLNTKQID